MEPKKDSPERTPERIVVIPSFHYDVAYLKRYSEYLPRCFQILDEALRILDAEPQYRFLVEQVILLEAYWDAHPERRKRLQKLAADGRLAFGPGTYVMPDMNHPDGESIYRQVFYGKRWLRDHLSVDPSVCWIADCWGHHAQLPQILRQCGYDYYVFWRCMRRDVLRRSFRWVGIDGTEIRARWLPRGYANIQFPSGTGGPHASDLTLRSHDPDQLRAICDDMLQFPGDASVVLCNGGDFMYPQADAPALVRALNATGELAPISFATPDECLPQLAWDRAPEVHGEFNSALQGTFTSNITIKQRVRAASHRLLSVETFAAIQNLTLDLDAPWKLLLKQQFHDIICGTICDGALVDATRELDEVERGIAEAAALIGTQSGTSARAPAGQRWFNPLPFRRTERIFSNGRPFSVSIDG